MTGYFEMSGYAGYVWPAYGAALAILGGFTVSAVLRHRTAERRLRAMERRR